MAARTALLVSLARTCCGALPQVPLPLTDSFPRVPSPLVTVDWRGLASDAVDFIFDATRVGPHLPLLWWDTARRNVNATSFGVPSYVGGATGDGAAHESIAGAALVLTAALAGRNVSCLSGGGFECVDVERMLLEYFDVQFGSGIWTDVASPNMSLWYASWVNMLPVMVAGASGTGALLGRVRDAGRAWLRVEAALGAPLPDFNVTRVDWVGGVPHGVAGDDRSYPLPVAAAGVAWQLYATRAALGESDADAPALLRGATDALNYLFTVPYNCYWEVLLPFGALAAARINAEQGTRYNVSRLLNFVLEDDLPSVFPFRWGWGTIAESWSGVDVFGLTGAVTDRGGYAFAMDTFATLSALLPVARYEAQFARALGVYAANAANAARLFFPRFNAPGAQSDADWVTAAGEGADALAYEGVRRWGFNETDGNITGPYATGDGKSQDHVATNLAVYGGAYVGLMAALVVPLPGAPAGVAAFDLVATDWFARPAAPTTLVYNGRATHADAALPLPPGRWDVYDAVAQEWAARNATRTATVTVAPDAAAVFVTVAAGARVVRDEAHNWLLADGVVIDWQLEPRGLA